MRPRETPETRSELLGAKCTTFGEEGGVAVVEERPAGLEDLASTSPADEDGLPREVGMAVVVMFCLTMTMYEGSVLEAGT